MVPDYHQRNDASRLRLNELVAGLDEETLQRRINEEWTVGAVLAHLAFWDQSCVWRWDEFDRTGTFPSLSGEVVDLINTASLPGWRALPGSAVKEMVLRAAAAADARTESLSDAALAYVTETGRTFILERYEHRTEHVDEIERFLAR
jgi:hypothetical protein